MFINLVGNLKNINIMITREEYNKALDIIEAYHKQLLIYSDNNKLINALERNDYITYNGGIRSKHLTIGKKYRLIRKPYNGSSAVENDIGRGMDVKTKYFHWQ